MQRIYPFCQLWQEKIADSHFRMPLSIFINYLKVKDYLPDA
jgi:hypothetical protein